MNMNVKYIENVIRRAIDTCDIAGMNLLVEKEGKEVLYYADGMADWEAQKPMRRDTIFRLYSQTKPVTAAAAMILMERGQLDLCQPVSDFLPAFTDKKLSENGKFVEVKNQMLVHDLLRMTSGLPYPNNETDAGKAVGKVYEEVCSRLHGDNPMTTREFADALAACPLAFEPGSSWDYGTSADVLGAVIEVVSGKKLSEFMKEELFDPLGMKDTAFWVPREKQHRLAVTYRTVCDDGNYTRERYTGDNLGISNSMERPPAYESGGAGLASTLDDYMKFARMLLQNGELNGKRILQPETVRYMTTGQLLEKQQRVMEDRMVLDGYTYANLMRVAKEPSKAGLLVKEGEYGWDGWLGVYFANFPKEKITILLGMQKTDAGTFALTRKIRNIILSSLE